MSQITDQRITSNPMPEREPVLLEPAKRTAWQWVEWALTPLSSLRLTVVLLALSMFLVFVGTLAQKEVGITSATNTYFRSFLVMVPFQLFVEFGKVFLGFGKDWYVGGSFPFFGGWLLGFVMLANLFAAHLVRFRMTWKRSGIFLIHFGIVVMMLGELVTGLWAVESRMTIAEGENIDYAEVTDKPELAVVDPSNPDADHVVVIPTKLVKKGGVVSDPQLPFEIKLGPYWKNSNIVRLEKDAEPKGKVYTSSIGARYELVERPEESGTSSRSDVPTVEATFLKKGTNESLGTYQLSLWFDRNVTQRLPAYRFTPQTVTVDGKTYQVSLRPKRLYKPYSVHLLKFTHEVYPGTTTPKNYASRVTLTDPERKEKRDVVISMNDPLRYSGETFYQSGFLPGNKGTVLQVVANPGWVMPYVSCVIVALGMLIHFGLHLVDFVQVKLTQRPPPQLPVPAPKAKAPQPSNELFDLSVVVPSLVVGLAALMVVISMTSAGPSKGKIDLTEAAKLTVVADGRTKPLDTVARTSMVIINKRQSYKDEAGDTQPALLWLLDTANAREWVRKVAGRNQEPDNSPLPPAPAVLNLKIFRIENLEVLNHLDLKQKPGSWRYSFVELMPTFTKLQTEADRIQEIDDKKRNLYEHKLMELWHHLGHYMKLIHGDEPRIIPVDGGLEEWKSYHEVRKEIELRMREVLRNPEARDHLKELEAKQKGGGERALATLERRILLEQYPAAEAWERMLNAYRDNDPDEFNKAVSDFSKHQGRLPGRAASTAKVEYFFNSFGPFFITYGLYVIVFVMTCIGWFAASPVLMRSSLWLAMFTFVLHGVALTARMWIQGRPPVTNLYSSAVFICFGCVALGLLLEAFFRNGIGVAAASLLGASTSLVANYLADSKGDTLEMMQAVLDTNFWLATHVTCITLGYSATFFAGFLGMIFIGLGVFTDRLDQNVFRSLGQMIYGVLCFATLLSFVGTVLGGIWADQSWGRFWGWDPKENGALLIVQINALILHARWAGLIKQRGLAVLTVVGNMVTGWSWFGTNQLGVGLHAYGFNDTLAVGLTAFWVSQLVFIGLGLVPPEHWCSYGKVKPTV